MLLQTGWTFLAGINCFYIILNKQIYIAIELSPCHHGCALVAECSCLIFRWGTSDNVKIISRPQGLHWQTNGRCHKDSGHLSTPARFPVNIIDCTEPERVNFPLHHTVHGWHGDSQNKRGCITFESSNVDILGGQGATAAATAVGNWLKYFVFLTHAVSLLCLQQCGTWPQWMKRYLFATLKYPLNQYQGIIFC